MFVSPVTSYASTLWKGNLLSASVALWWQTGLCERNISISCTRT